MWQADCKGIIMDRIFDTYSSTEDYIVQDLESKIAGFIEVSDTDGKDDKQIYQMMKAWIDRGLV